ncbi:MAG TPA: lipoyl(octanoyl) transferase LipB [Thermoleophilia bacterium]|nr:lipoyl(octanoyl) transferase LipB [Thermoleophilia bacterium]
MANSAEAIPALDLGLAPYLPVQELQGRLRAAVLGGAIPGVLLLLEHEAVITLGTRAGAHDLRPPVGAAPQLSDGAIPAGSDCADSLGSEGEPLHDVPVVRSERGGQATLHAPGQLVSYPIMPIEGHDLRAYVCSLEEILMILLDELGVKAHRRSGRPGLYVRDEKIASVGLRCRRWVASHGTSLNVSVDLSLFDRIVSCGEPDLRQTSLDILTGRSFPMAEIKARYIEAACRVFGWKLMSLRALTFDVVEKWLGLPGC